MTYRHIQQCMYLLVWCIYVICVCIQYVFLCIGLYVSVSVCMCIYPSVWACICLYHMQHPSHVHNYTWHFFYHKYHIWSVILLHICMYSFILTSISAYVLVYECINKYVVYICLYVLYTYMQSLSGPPRSACMGLEVGSTRSSIAWELLFTPQISCKTYWYAHFILNVCRNTHTDTYRHIHTHTWYRHIQPAWA